MAEADSNPDLSDTPPPFRKSLLWYTCNPPPAAFTSSLKGEDSRWDEPVLLDVLHGLVIRSTCNGGDLGYDPCVGKIPGGRKATSSGGLENSMDFK